MLMPSPWIPNTKLIWRNWRQRPKKQAEECGQNERGTLQQDSSHGEHQTRSLYRYSGYFKDFIFLP